MTDDVMKWLMSLGQRCRTGHDQPWRWILFMQSIYTWFVEQSSCFVVKVSLDVTCHVPIFITSKMSCYWVVQIDNWTPVTGDPSRLFRILFRRKNKYTIKFWGNDVDNIMNHVLCGQCLSPWSSPLMRNTCIWL